MRCLEKLNETYFVSWSNNTTKKATVISVIIIIIIFKF